MKAVLLCPGPSLSRLDAVPPCDIAAAVNRAACRFACDWWVATDYPLIRDWRGAVLGTPRLFTRGGTWRDIAHRGWFDATKATTTDDLACPVPHWSDKTATATLVLLASLGATQIDVYGSDMTDAPDFDGFTQKGTDRTAARWSTERATWDEIAAWLAGRGVSVNRITL